MVTSSDYAKYLMNGRLGQEVSMQDNVFSNIRELLMGIINK